MDTHSIREMAHGEAPDCCVASTGKAAPVVARREE